MPAFFMRRGSIFDDRVDEGVVDPDVALCRAPQSPFIAHAAFLHDFSRGRIVRAVKIIIPYSPKAFKGMPCLRKSIKVAFCFYAIKLSTIYFFGR